MTPTPPQEQTEREAFESWARRERPSIFGRSQEALWQYDAAFYAWKGARASMQAQAPEVAALQREVEELRADALRYRWLREHCSVARRDYALRDVGIDCMVHVDPPLMFCEGEAALRQLDIGIDAAMASKAEVPNG